MRSKSRKRLYAILTVACLQAAAASAQQAQRSVVPIREVVIRPVGTPRYFVNLSINGMSVETGLDTGSVGLRILPRTVRAAGIVPGAEPVRYSYGSGVELDGYGATADIRIGTMRGPVPVQAVERVSCVGGKECRASKVPPGAYGLMGSGVPGQGFQAIMGTRLNGGQVPNPLTALGIRRWIVHLPTRGGRGGALVLNPNARDLAGFVPIRSGAGVPGTVAACLSVDRPGARRICGPTLLDVGAPALLVRGASRPPAWHPGAPALLQFFREPEDAGPGASFTAGDEAFGAKARFVQSRDRGVSVNAGTLPFFAFDVLFDQEASTISIRPNGSSRGAVRALN